MHCKVNDMRNLKMAVAEPEAAPSLLAINIFARQAGLSPVTLWRWRRAGWLRTVNVAGQVFKVIYNTQRLSGAGLKSTMFWLGPAPS